MKEKITSLKVQRKKKPRKNKEGKDKKKIRWRERIQKTLPKKPNTVDIKKNIKKRKQSWKNLTDVYYFLKKVFYSDEGRKLLSKILKKK